jgi:putative membrane protein
VGQDQGNRGPNTAMQPKSSLRQQPTCGVNLSVREKRSSMNRLACVGIVLTVLPLSAGIDRACAQTTDTLAAISATASKLSPVDYNFVAQANLGAPFQVDSGRVAEDKARTAEIRDYAHLMVTSHIPVVEALNKILQRKGLTAPPNTLLQGAYRAMVTSLKAESRKALDRDYVDGQIEYQKGNAALFQYEIQYGTDADLKEFARATLPKIEDHLQRALRLAGASKRASNYRLAPANRRFAYRYRELKASTLKGLVARAFSQRM